MEPISSFEPVKVEAMINSLQQKREVFIVKYDDANHVKAIYGNKLCMAVYNGFVGLFYVDDLYGVVDTLETPSGEDSAEKQTKGERQ